MNIHHSIYFKKAALQHKDLIFKWLEQPHMQEFWDNSQEHKEDILNFINGTAQTYFYGTTQYWIGYLGNDPFCFILSDQMLLSQNDLSNLHRQYFSKSGNTITLDFGIGDPAFLGKHLASPTLKAFMEFYRQEIDPKADTFFIDPDVNNPRAIHVYTNAGFELLGHYAMKQGEFKGQQTCIMVKKFA